LQQGSVVNKTAQVSLEITMQAGVWFVDLYNDSPALLSVTFTVTASARGARCLPHNFTAFIVKTHLSGNG